MSQNYLPEELEEQILAILPVKSLLKFRCVSKRWRNLISSISFKNLHLQKNKKELVFYRELNIYLVNASVYLMLEDENFSYNGGTRISHPLFKDGSFHIVGNCDGVLCLSYGRSDFALWNPNIRKTVTVPTPNITSRSHGIFTYFTGFGFDCTRNDYKLVRVMYLSALRRKYPPLVEVYSLRDRCWHMVSNNLDVSLQSSSAACMNGACYWLAEHRYRDRKRKRDVEFLIVVFNWRDELMTKMGGPKGLHYKSHYNSSSAITVRDDLLALLVCDLDEAWTEQTICVWVMKEYGVVESWTAIYHVNYTPTPSPSPCAGSLFLARSTVLFEVDDFIYLYNLKTKKWKHIKSNARFFCWGTYTPTLALLDQPNKDLLSSYAQIFPYALPADAE